MAIDLKLRFIMSAIDSTGSIFSRFKSKIGGISQETQNTGASAKQMAQAFVFETLKMNAAIAVVQRSVDFLQNKFLEAGRIQVENLTATSTFASLTGASFDEAGAFVESFNAKISESAASLPGSTAEYAALARQVQDSLIPAFQDASGAITDMSGFEDTLQSITESYTVASVAAGVDAGNAGLGITKLLSGGSIAEVRQIATFEQNPTILNKMESMLAEMGATSFSDVGLEDRIRILKEAGEFGVTDEFKRQASDSVEGLMESFKSTIFDPQTGLFGVMRDLDKEMEGSQTAFKAFNQVLKSILGTGGIFANITEIVGNLGFADPMSVVQRALLKIDGFLQGINRYLTYLTFAMESGESLLQGIMTTISATGLRDRVGKGVDKLIGFFNRFDLTQIADGIGSFLEKSIPIINNLLSESSSRLKDFLRGVNWAAIGEEIGRFIYRVMGDILQFASRIDYASVLVAIGEFAIATIKFAGGLFWGMADQLAIESADLLSSTLDSMGKGVDLFKDALIQTIRELFGKLTEYAVNFLTPAGIIGAVRGQNLGAQAAQAGGNLLSRMTAPLQGAATAATNSGRQPQARASFLGFLPDLGGVLGAVSREMRNMPIGEGLNIANTAEAVLGESQLSSLISGVANIGRSIGSGDVGGIISGVQGAIAPMLGSNMESGIGSIISGVQGSIAPMLGGLANGSMGAGGIGGVLSGLQGALSGGSGGIGEIISNVLSGVSATAAPSGPASNNNFNVNISVPGAGGNDPEAIAQFVLRKFEQWFNEEVQSQLT